MTGPVIRSLRIVFGILCLALAYFVHQGEFFFLAGLYSLLFGIYFFTGRKQSLLNKENGSIVLLIKIAMLFAFPLASDDIYRFYWDGCTLFDGISPYKYTPHELMSVHPAGWQSEFGPLNSKEYYSVYPPMLQGIFVLCASLSFHSVYLFSVFWKGIVLIADYRTIGILKKMDVQGNLSVAYWYAWNPLVLYEVIANGHPEGLMIYFLVLFIYWIKKSDLDKSAVLLALAASIKLFPILLLAFIPKYLELKSSIRYVLVCTGVFVLSMLPVLPFPGHWLESLQLYFGKFEFNGSIFEGWKAMDYRRFGFDNAEHIAPYLGIAFLVWCAFLFLKQKLKNQASFLSTVFWMWLGYLLLSTTVHPWYIVPVIVWGMLSGRFFILAWSATAILSYSWYDGSISQSWKYGWIGIEYASLSAAYFYQKLKLTS